MRITNIYQAPNYSYINRTTKKNSSLQIRTDAENTKNTTSQTMEKLPSLRYPVSFGAKKDNDRELEDIVLKYFYEKIPHFKDAAILLTPQEKRMLARLARQCPQLPSILAGDYVIDLGSTNSYRKIIDLKSIAEANKTHPERPINLYDRISGNQILARTLGHLSEHPSDSSFKIKSPTIMGLTSDQVNPQTTIKYRDNFLFEKYVQRDHNIDKISDLQSEALKEAKLSSELKAFFSNKQNPVEFQQKIYELTEIPYFTAAISNLSQEEIKKLAEIIIADDPLSSEALFGNIKLTNLKDINIPVINLERIAKHNMLYPEDQQSLLDEFHTMSMFNVIMNTIDSMPDIAKTPNLMLMDALDTTPADSLSIEGLTERRLFENPEFKVLREQFEYFVFFKNQFEVEPAPIADTNEETTTENIQSLKTKIEPAPAPEVVKNLLSSNKLDREQKELLHFYGMIPMIYENIKHLDESNIIALVKMHQKFGDCFTKLLQGEIKEVTPTPNGESLACKQIYNPNIHSPKYIQDTILNSDLTRNILRIISSMESVENGMINDITFTMAQTTDTKEPTVVCLTRVIKNNKIHIIPEAIPLKRFPRVIQEKISNSNFGVFQINLDPLIHPNTGLDKEDL